MVEFLKKYFIIIVSIFLLLVWFQQCSNSQKMNKVLTETKTLKNIIDTLKTTTYTKTELNKQLQIMGLEAEKRMIQSTDRKLWDLNRQNDIDKEIKLLKGEKINEVD